MPFTLPFPLSLPFTPLSRGAAPDGGHFSLRFSADSLNALLGQTPADNTLKLQAPHHWLSDQNGVMLKGLFGLSQLHRQVLTAWGLPGEWSQAWLKPMVSAAAQAVGAGQDPDAVAADNLRIEGSYASGIKRIVEALVDKSAPDELGVFDRERCRWACENPLGQVWLLNELGRLQALEWQYHSVGLTRFVAYKHLLRSLIQVIAGEPIGDPQRQPYRKPSPKGGPRESDAQYLADCEARLLTLLAHDAFDIRRFALTSPKAHIGYCEWHNVEGSALYATRLRHYPLPDGIQPNGKTLYIASPMINRCEIFDLAEGKSVIEGMLKLGYTVYMVDYGNPGADQADLGLAFFGKVVHDRYLELIKQRHPGQTIEVMAYCMGGALFLPYLARRTEELAARGEPLDIRQVALMSTPVKFDDADSGHKAMRDVIRAHYDMDIMQAFYSGSNVPPQTIEAGMHAIQPGVAYTVAEGFFSRAAFPGAVDDAAPFLHWLTVGTRFPVKAHCEWIMRVFMGNEIWRGEYRLPSSVPELDGQPVNMEVLNDADVAIFDYRGLRDPIAPAGSCVASERWGRRENNRQVTKGGLNRTIEKNIGHIFVVSKSLLGDYLETVADFLADEPPPPSPPPRRKPLRSGTPKKAD